MADPKKILIFDENEKNRKQLSDFLNRVSIPTDEATSLKEAVEKLMNSKTYTMAVIRIFPIDSRVLSIIQSIKTLNPQLGILMLSDLENPELAVSLLENGPIDQLIYPDNLSGIFSAIKSELVKRELKFKQEEYRKALRRLCRRH